MPVTPVILTFNEGCNIKSTLASLAWAPRVVVLDSGSTDRTEQIARSFCNVNWFVRQFDTHRLQWLYAIHETSITTDYVLALDADMCPGVGFQDELDAFLKRGEFAGAQIPFEYRILGHPIRVPDIGAWPGGFRISRTDTSVPEESGSHRSTGPLSGLRSERQRVQISILTHSRRLETDKSMVEQPDEVRFSGSGTYRVCAEDEY